VGRIGPVSRTGPALRGVKAERSGYRQTPDWQRAGQDRAGYREGGLKKKPAEGRLETDCNSGRLYEVRLYG
jgi:hypothetical protein